ncbi:MAG: tRNA-wybutosine modification methyltransferase TYW3 [Candidatus Njordarchaeales archaeon]
MVPIITREFIQRKKAFLRKLAEAKALGEVDEDIIPLLETINLLPFVYTTSSCSGRILLIDVPSSGSKKESVKVAKWHSPINPECIWKIVSNYTPRGILWFKLEGMIIALAVSGMEWASFLIRLARFLGFKESGIRSINASKKHVIMDFSSTEKIYTPIATKDQGVIVSKEYLYTLTNLANNLLLRTKERMRRLIKAFTILHEIISSKKALSPEKISFERFRDAL